MSYSWAQSGNQQDQTQTDPNSVDQRDQDVNQDVNQRQKPASEPNTMQNQSQTQSQTTTEKSQTQETTSKSETKTDKNRKRLPATAGELPLLTLIGVLSLAAAGSTRLFARAKSTR